MHCNIPILLGHTKVDHVNHILFRRATTNKKVVWFDVSINQVFLMHRLNSCNLPRQLSITEMVPKQEYHLLGGHSGGLDGKLAATHVKQVLE